jgi:ABC-2 type transport system permease protein
MRSIGPLLIANIRNNFRSKGAVFVWITLALMLFAMATAAACLFLLAPAVEAQVPDPGAVGRYLCLIMYFACFLGVGLALNVFTAQLMVKEKAQRIIESLLATPLKVKDVWLAKSLAVFLPGVLVGEVLALIALIAVNCIYIVPKMGFLITPWMAISSFVAVPAMYFSLGLLVHLVGLAGDAIAGNVIAQVFLSGITALMINLGINNVLDPTLSPFTWVNLLIAAVLGIVVLALQPLLTKERIVLSCRK